MALDALEHRDVSEIDRVLERLISFVARLALSIGESAKIDWMLKRISTYVEFSGSCGVVNHCMADVAIISDYFPSVTHMLAVVAAETSGKIQMADIVWMGFPVCLHLREEIGAEDAL